MKVISYAGFVFEDNDFQTGFPEDAVRAQWSLLPNVETRLGAPALFTGSRVSERVIPVQVSYVGPYIGNHTYEAAFNTLLGALDPLNPEPRTLVVQSNDGVTELSCEAIITLPGADPGDGTVDWMLITFVSTDPFWTETTDSTATLLLDAGTPSDTVTNSGAASAAPTITLENFAGYLIAARDRRQVTVTNDADLPLEREVIVQQVPYSVGMDGGASLLKDGTFHPVTRHYPTVAAYQWFAFPVNVDPGESEVYDLIGQINTEGDLDTYTRFDGNYCAQDLTFESWSVTSATTTVITVSGANWPTNRWAGACMQVYVGTAAPNSREILSNTANTLTVRRAFSTAPDSTSKITLIGSGWYDDGGVISASSTTTITDSSQSWVPNSLVGLTVEPALTGIRRTVAANTATQITFTPAISPAPTVSNRYYVYGPNYHRYYVDEVKHSSNHRGGWQINKRFTQPSKTLWGADILTAWAPFLLTENGDDFNSARWTKVNMGGSDDDYFPNLNATRRRGQDRRLPEEGQADGVAIYNPLGYQAMRFDYRFKNPSGIAKALVAGREAGGDEFEPYVEDTTTYATLTTVAAQNIDLSAYGSPEQIYMGLQPADGVEISREAAESDEANMRWYTTLRLWLDTKDRLTVSYGAVETVIPIEDEIRIGDYALQIGQRDGQRLYIRMTDSIILDCANARAYLDDGSTQTDITYAVTPVYYRDATTTVIADRWPVLEPGVNTVTVTTDVWTLGGGYDVQFSWQERHFG